MICAVWVALRCHQILNGIKWEGRGSRILLLLPASSRRRMGAVRCWRGDDELSARRWKVTSAARSRERLSTLANQVLISSETESHSSNWQLFPDPLVSAHINGRARRIPHPQSVLKWDDMGFFTSMKIGGVLAFALGETLSCVYPVWGGGGCW